MSENITSSVARLYRAGSEHSRSMEKLRKAIDTLLRWIGKNLPTSFLLPDNCRYWRHGEFVQYTNHSDARFGAGIKMFFVNSKSVSEWPHEHVLYFSKLIASGWLDRLSMLLEKEAAMLGASAYKVEKFLAAK
ncbi:MAG: hypothetical protein A2928_04700 [Candidatus Taylorbacteria bacterium RIFCSPLOWO2_01_FULL_45_15b]|uniref:Uncharacterized protein n=1 Tax=Candidatus Taylorbacteria bacterium RIFCSPLOWO2_01_FULL_45_15b TaxID=1802319 RepID=A0A1G2NFL3_9BACT|nr:MAG: hypothetical protein A2928_04700 [Candidatus Taylorbacteria bacterium RIFCSPLOWO2_01_FULL_45_15b]